jgi:hypothetical protein|tara:strand:+ start:454 stop:1200 length:747 start_codon:yes stop_codon:yes gene_type:complete
MNKNTRITKVAVNSNNEIVGYSGRTKVDGWPIHAKAPKKTVNQFIKALEEEIKTDTLTLGVFGDMFDEFDEEMMQEFGLEEAEEVEEGEEEEREGMHINADYKAKYAQNNDSCGDKLANALHEVVTIQVPKHNKKGEKIGTKDACDLNALAKVAKANKLAERFKSWDGLNVGHVRMILRNTLNAMIKRGEKVVVGKIEWKENKKLQKEVAEKKKKSAKKFADLKKKAAAKKADKKDNRVKKNKKSKAA